ncbi:protein F46F5.4 [Ditylenchus destructor]|nr:protein F46F5.4 [Ditylenchus destructor]
MRRNSHLKWILFLDADIGVVNPRHEIEEFIHERTDAEIELIFFERLITWEIMAGSYLAKNTPFVHDFLTEWANYVSNDAFHQDDQGPLHQVFMKRFAPSHNNKCEKLYNNSMTFWPYMNYIACARFFLGIDTRSFGSHIKLIRRGDAWTRDGHHSGSAVETVAPVTSFWSDRDFMMHSWKDSSKLWKRPFVNNDTFQLEKCRLSSSRSREAIFEENWRYNETLRKSEKEIGEIIGKVKKDAIDGYEKSLTNVALEKTCGML